MATLVRLMVIWLAIATIVMIVVSCSRVTIDPPDLTWPRESPSPVKPVPVPSGVPGPPGS